jgi:hypothetical protein
VRRGEGRDERKEQLRGIRREQGGEITKKRDWKREARRKKKVKKREDSQ